MYKVQRTTLDWDFMGSDLAWANRDNPVYKDANLPAIFLAYADIYPKVTSRLCSAALKNLSRNLKAWLSKDGNVARAKGIKFLEADWQRIPEGQGPRLGLEDDNILILLPTEYYPEVSRDSRCLNRPGWYNTPPKRNILYFYPGSSPIKPVGRLYDRYMKDKTSSEDQVPMLNVHPNNPDLCFPWG
jgi:hypothetical protein